MLDAVIISVGNQMIISNVQISNKSVLARVNKNNFKVDSPASSGGQGKYREFVSFPCPPLDAPLSNFSRRFFV